MTKTSLPKFDSPPVIETVLSVQFSQIPNFSSAHAGWFWKNYLDPSWDQVKSSSRIGDQFERFGDNSVWRLESGFTIQAQPMAERLQIIKSENQRMIQVQDNRFIHNWRKSESGDYPSYKKLLPEFKENFSKFQQFTSDSDNPDLELNQWEVTYVNHLPKGELWNSATDWVKICPNFDVMVTDIPGLVIDNFRGSWSFVINKNQGRLHVDMKHARLVDESGPEILMLQLTARGPVNKNIGLWAGFDIGHEAIVRSFADITSPEYHKIWGRRK